MIFKIYPATIQNLKVQIEEIRAITSAVVQHVNENFSMRLRQCVKNYGRQLTGVIFKK